MRARVSFDLRNWNGTWDYEYSQLAPIVVITLSRGEDELKVELTEKDGRRFAEGEELEIWTTSFHLIKIKAFTNKNYK